MWYGIYSIFVRFDYKTNQNEIYAAYKYTKISENWELTVRTEGWHAIDLSD